MLTLEEQLVFLEEKKKSDIGLLTHLQSQFGEIHKEIFTERISHVIFCYDSVLKSLQELIIKNQG